VKVNHKRLQKIKSSIPIRFFHEKSFDTSFRNKILSDIPLDYSKVDYSNILACSPLLNKDQEQHLFRKYNYFKYRILKLTTGVKKSEVNPHLKFSKPVNLEKLGDKSLKEIERLIFQSNKIRNLLLESNLRLIIKQLSRYYQVDSYNRDEFFSHGYCHVLKAVDCFDYRKGFKFSTYCINVLQTNFYRDSSYVRKLSENLSQFEDIEIEDKKEVDYSEINQGYNIKFINEMFDKIKIKLKNPDIKIKIVRDYYGLDGDQKNLCQLAKELNLSKERIRQIKLEVLRYLSNKVAKEVVYDPLV